MTAHMVEMKIQVSDLVLPGREGGRERRTARVSKWKRDKGGREGGRKGTEKASQEGEKETHVGGKEGEHKSTTECREERKRGTSFHHKTSVFITSTVLLGVFLDPTTS